PTFFGLKKEKFSFNSLKGFSNYAEYTNSVFEATFLHAIAIVIEESVLEETKKLSAWSLLIDENISYFLDYEVTIKELYAYFVNSHNQWQNFLIFQVQDEEFLELLILQAVST
ncbi:11425_t:CDS:2, partial [Racocetra fulgida]